MLLRPAQRGEAGLLTDIALRSKRAWGYDDAFMRRILPDMLVTPRMIDEGYAVLAIDAEEPVGYLLMRMNGEHEAFLNDLFIVPERMRCGVGSQLLAHGIAWSRAQGARRVSLVSDPNATGFYERRGFTRDGEVASTVIDGRALPRMVLLL
ncbi:MAG TPA: GNAT family N-acetyltransferase [Candidatus Baltobacteraceae bacterium]|jgi:GNAT superfamily N-acetyltransferase|nr:GNAT family N-acetyltransferase [Candidatus Baltobacteraceae bacterium]